MELKPLRVLLVEDSVTDGDLILRALREAGFAPVHEQVQTAETMRAALQRQPWDIVLSDYYMPGFEAPRALAVLQEHDADIPFIVVSGSVGEDTAVAAMKAGAIDYIMKDRLQRLGPAIGRALEDAAVRRERRQLQDQLTHSQRLESVGRLAGGIAHDFNNVLTAVLGATEIMLLDTPPDGAHREELEIVRDAANRARDLIRQLLAFSARQVLEPKVIDLNDHIRNVVKLLGRVIGEDVKLATKHGEDLPAVRADPGQLEQVLMNLAVNARDAMPDGGTLTLATSKVEVTGPVWPAPSDGGGPLAPGRYVMLEVTDSGTGMDDATKSHLFEPFFTTKPRGKGTGLGLATVYGIVRQSDGRIAVRSALGQGTMFRVYLPAVAEQVTLITPTRPAAALTRGAETLLLVEDEPLVRVLARKVLANAGYTVLVAPGGAEALEIARGHAGKIDLLVTDVVMPEMSGRELARALAPLRPDLKVLFVSGYSDEAVARHGVLDPGTAFMQKPFTPSGLAAKVREVLNDGG